jgi:hypothetical protein
VRFQKKKALDILKQSLGDKLYTEDDREKLLTTPVKDLIMSGKQICVFLHPRIYENFKVDGVEYSDSFIAKEYGFFNASKWIENKWKYVRKRNENCFCFVIHHVPHIT